ETIRDIHLSMVARSGRRIPSAIAEVLPQSLKGFAGQMARAMVDRPGPGAQPGPAGPPVQGGPPPTQGGRPGAPPHHHPQQGAPGHVSNVVGARDVPLGGVRLGGDPAEPTRSGPAEPTRSAPAEPTRSAPPVSSASGP